MQSKVFDQMLDERSENVREIFRAFDGNSEISIRIDAITAVEDVIVD
ncbi:MAG TPA: hypothetical protein VN939_07800 [Chthoniobacterales bacterium]|nr:hypothetical protein [Chthoniobacterales bacterium]